jgi:hypothetical protein
VSIAITGRAQVIKPTTGMVLFRNCRVMGWVDGSARTVAIRGTGDHLS